jgi:hypothetical protein
MSAIPIPFLREGYFNHRSFRSDAKSNYALT